MKNTNDVNSKIDTTPKLTAKTYSDEQLLTFAQNNAREMLNYRLLAEIITFTKEN